MEKKPYETPKMEVVELENDVILTSGNCDLYDGPETWNYSWVNGSTNNTVYSQC